MKKKAGKVLFLASLWSFSLRKIPTLEMVKSGRYRAMKMVLEGQCLNRRGRPGTLQAKEEEDSLLLGFLLLI